MFLLKIWLLGPVGQQINLVLPELLKKTRELFREIKLANELAKQQKVFEKRLDEINGLKVADEEFMLVDDNSLGEVENWVKLHNEAVSKYNTVYSR